MNQRGFVLAATIIGSAMAFIDGTVVNVALPALQRDFQASMASVQWVVEAYALFLSALLLVGGSLGDIYGRRRVYVVGVSLFALASIGCGAAPDIHALIAARAFQGIGGALLVAGGLAIITATFAEEERGQAIGTWSGWSAIATVIGPLLGGWTIDHLSWRWAFLINIPMAAAVLVLVWRYVAESRGEQARIDTVGGTLVTAGLGGVVYGLIESGSTGPRWLPLGGGLVLLAAFVVSEFVQAHPMVPPSLFLSRNFSGANLLTLLLYGALSGTFFFVPLDMIQIHRYTATQAGAASVPFAVLMFLLSRWSGGLVDRVGPRLPLVAGPLVAAAGFALYSRVGTDGSYWTTFFPAVLVLGLGMTITVAPLTTTVMNSVDPTHVGTASGINNAVSRTAGLLAIAVMGLYMQNAFNVSLEPRLNSLSLPAPVHQQLDAQRDLLGAIQPPAHFPAVREAVDSAFADSFRGLCWLMCGLAATSAVIAAITIQGGDRAAHDE